MWKIFKDENEYNEKAIIGFISFAIMVMFGIVDLVTGLMGQDLVINGMIYYKFLFHLVIKILFFHMDKLQLNMNWID